MALVHEYEKTLRPCAHCGDVDVSIRSEFDPVKLKQHIMHVGCYGNVSSEKLLAGETGITFGCGARSAPCAFNNCSEKSICLALKVIRSWWNRRPGEEEVIDYGEEIQ